MTGNKKNQLTENVEQLVIEDEEQMNVLVKDVEDSLLERSGKAADFSRQTVPSPVNMQEAEHKVNIAVGLKTEDGVSGSCQTYSAEQRRHDVPDVVVLPTFAIVEGNSPLTVEEQKYANYIEAYQTIHEGGDAKPLSLEAFQQECFLHPEIEPSLWAATKDGKAGVTGEHGVIPLDQVNEHQLIDVGPEKSQFFTGTIPKRENSRIDFLHTLTKEELTQWKMIAPKKRDKIWKESQKQYDKQCQKSVSFIKREGAGNRLKENAIADFKGKVKKAAMKRSLPKKMGKARLIKEIAMSGSSIKYSEVYNQEQKQKPVDKAISILISTVSSGAKKIIAVGGVAGAALLLFLLIITGILLSLMGVTSAKNEDSGSKRIVEAAMKEYEYQQTTSQFNSGQKYWQWFGFESRVEWCATFISYCANECGFIDSGIIPKSAAVVGYRNFFEERGEYHPKEGYTPKTGDIIIFENGMSHVGIVQGVEDNRVLTVEGNTGYDPHDRIGTYSYELDNASISGYGSPSYPEEGDFSGENNAEIAWNYLKSQGFSDAASAGIMGNLQQESGLNPDRHQDGGGPGRGIAQWTVDSDRWNGLMNMADSMGKEWNDLEPQLAFLMYEFSGGDSTCAYILEAQFGGLGNFKQTEDIHWAVLAFEKSYERAGTPMMENRNRYADEFYEKFSK